MKILSLLLLLFSASAFAQPTPLIQSRELQNMWVKVGFQIGIDTDPAWSWHSMAETNYDVFVVESPDLYYPPAVFNVRYNKYHPPQDPKIFKKAAYFTLLNMQKKFGATEHFKFVDIQPATYGLLEGYEQTSQIYLAGEPFSNKIFVGLNHDNKLIVLNAVTLPNKIDHLQPTLERMWGSIKFLTSASTDN
jgi:hypothetical protein